MQTQAVSTDDGQWPGQPTDRPVGGVAPDLPRPPGSHRYDDPELLAIDVMWAVRSDDRPRPRTTSSAAVVERQDWAASVLSHVHIWPGMRVLELGRGTRDDYTTVLLARLVTPGGRVVSIAPSRTGPRIERTVNYDGQPTSLTVTSGPVDGGWPQDAPYDAIFSWLRMPVLPYRWLAQCRPQGGVLITPVDLVDPDQQDRAAIVRVVLDASGRPIHPQLIFADRAFEARLVADVDGYRVELTGSRR